MKVIERNIDRPLIILEIPEQAALPPGPDFSEGHDSLEDENYEDAYAWLHQQPKALTVMVDKNCSASGIKDLEFFDIGGLR